LPFGAQVEIVSDVRGIVTEYLAWYSYNEPWFGPASNAGVKTTAGAPAAQRRAVRHERLEVNMDLATVDKLLTTTRSVRARLDLTHSDRGRVVPEIDQTHIRQVASSDIACCADAGRWADNQARN